MQNSKKLREEESQTFVKALSECKNKHLEIFQHRKSSHEPGKKITSHYLESFFKNYESLLVESLKSELGKNVRNKMSSERELYKKCFAVSFEARIWENLYKFVVNINLFMKEMFQRESEEFLSECRKAFEANYRKFIKTTQQTFREVLKSMPPDTKNLKQFNEALNKTKLKEYILFSSLNFYMRFKVGRNSRINLNKNCMKFSVQLITTP